VSEACGCAWTTRGLGGAGFLVLLALVRQTLWVLGGVCDPQPAALLERGLTLVPWAVGHPQQVEVVEVDDVLGQAARLPQITL